MNTNDKITTDSKKAFLQNISPLLIALILAGSCIGAIMLNTIFLTLPHEAEQALVKRVNVDYCEGRGCTEIQVYNVDREDTRNDGIWCVNLHIHSPLRENNSYDGSYMVYRGENGAWETERIPGSICDTLSLEGRKYILK